eukprot:m.107770 g.107770  ORF g.107770 m.107770 type:complete len:464 (+) comp15197_c1_seq2:116-1507(+)
MSVFGLSSSESTTVPLLPKTNARLADDDDEVLVNPTDVFHRNNYSTPAKYSSNGQGHRPRYRFPSFKSKPRSDRFLDRQGAFKQSRGNYNLLKIVPNGAVASLRFRDWFHTLLTLPSPQIALILSTIYIVSSLVGAGLFYAANKHCDLQLHSFQDAFMLSVETLATIGYGVPDPYFGGCVAGPFIVLSQALVGLFINALCIGVIFARISRGNKRSATVVFSNKAIIREVNGKWYFLFQVCDLKKHALVEAHVRLYALRHRPVAGAPASASAPSEVRASSTMRSTNIPLTTTHRVWFQTHVMRTINPNDETNGMILLSLPDQVLHCIDEWSPLMPAAQEIRKHEPSTMFLFPQPVARSADFENGAREAFGSREPRRVSRAEIEDKFRNDHIEILCLVEGVDAATSYTVQARHSYTLNDIVFDMQFAPCVSVDHSGACVLDLHYFHDLLPLNATHSPEDTVSSIL